MEAQELRSKSVTELNEELVALRREQFNFFRQPGRMLYEMEGVAPDVAREAFRLAAHKLPVQTRFVTREEL